MLQRHHEDHFWPLDSTSGLSISEDQNHIYIEAHLPGLQLEDIEVSFDKGILWIQGSRKEEEEDSNKKYYKKAASSYSYRLQVPGMVDEKKEPEAIYKNGIIKVVFYKLKEDQSKKIKIKS